MWLPVPSAKVPEPRPGKCVADTRDLPDTVLNFIRKHPLMDSDVPHDAEGPAFYKRDVTFTKLAVDQVSQELSCMCSERAVLNPGNHFETIFFGNVEKLDSNCLSNSKGVF